MLHYFHPNVLLLLILPEKDLFLGTLLQYLLCITSYPLSFDWVRHLQTLCQSLGFSQRKNIFELFSAVRAFPLLPPAKRWYFLWSFSKYCFLSPLLKPLNGKIWAERGNFPNKTPMTVSPTIWSLCQNVDGKLPLQPSSTGNSGNTLYLFYFFLEHFSFFFFAVYCSL